MSDTAPIEQQTWLTSGDFTQADEPFRLWQAWFDEAVKGEPRDPTAMSLATVDPEGMPDVRTVLLKASMTAGSCSTPTPKATRGASSLPIRRLRSCSTGNRSTGRSASADRWS